MTPAKRAKLLDLVARLLRDGAPEGSANHAMACQLTTALGLPDEWPCWDTKVQDAISGSVDACRAIHARLLPSHRIEVIEHGPGWDVILRDATGRGVGHALGAPTEAIGRFAALAHVLARAA